MKNKPTSSKYSAAAIDRTAFIVGAASLSAFVFPACSEAETAPPICANGVHDDTPGIQWRLDRGLTVHIENRTLLLMTPICVRNPDASLALINTKILSGLDDKSVLVNGILRTGGAAGEGDR